MKRENLARGGQGGGREATALAKSVRTWLGTGREGAGRLLRPTQDGQGGKGGAGSGNSTHYDASRQAAMSDAVPAVRLLPAVAHPSYFPLLLASVTHLYAFYQRSLLVQACNLHSDPALRDVEQGVVLGPFLDDEVARFVFFERRLLEQ